MSHEEDQLPAHKRRAGRIESLHEFQQRALTYSPDTSPGTSEDHSYSIFLRPESSPHLSLSDASGDDDNASFRPRMTSRSRSLRSLFGNNRRRNKTFWHYYRQQAKLISFLILLGVIAGPLNYAMKSLYGLIFDLRAYLIDLTSNYTAQYIIWTAHTLVFSQIGLLFTRLSPVAAGSGVSQIKSILTGIDPRMYLPGYFDFYTLIAKIGGLICAMGAGLVVGTEGAYVHIMSIVTHHVLLSPPFRGFSQSLNARMQLLAAACAVGVAATFSSPIGGVLFSLEVTATYYLVSNYMKAFISSVSGALMLKLMRVWFDTRESSVRLITYPDDPYAMWELCFFALTGILLGLVATFVIFLIRVTATWRADWKKSDEKWKVWYLTWMDPIVVAIVCAACTFFPGQFSQNPSMMDVNELFAPDELGGAWTSISIYYSLSILGCVYAFLLPLCITLKLPTGVWVPTFIAGAAFGRLIGEFVAFLFPHANIYPGCYALAGAAAFAGVATGTVSAAVITLEITGLMSLILPIFVSTLCAIGASNLWKERSVYDTLLLVSKLPYLPLIDFDTDVTASHILEPNLVYVTKRSSVAKLLLAVQRLPRNDIPVVQNEDNMLLLGVVGNTQLRDMIRNYYTKYNLPDVEVDLGEEVKTVHNKFSWGTIMEKFSWNDEGGLNGFASVDQTYNQLTSSRDVKAGGVPFMLDDDKMLQLLYQGWSPDKRQVLAQSMKVSSAIRPIGMTVSSATPLDDLHMIFTMLRLDHCLICDHGALTGVVTTKGLLGAGTY